MRRNLFMACLLSTVLISTVLADNTKTTSRLQKQWDALTGDDEVKVALAILRIAKEPKEAMAFLKVNLKPVKADAKQVEELIRKLSSRRFAVREKASADLAYLGKYIKADLEKALAKATDTEVKARIKTLLKKFPQPPKPQKPIPPRRGGRGGVQVQVIQINGQRQVMINGVPVGARPPAPPVPQGPPKEWLRAVRAIAILEHLGTPEAKNMLKQMASGEPDALPTKEAKAALARFPN